MLIRFRSMIMLALVLLALYLQAAPIFKAGDRIVIYGDSITEQRLYSRYLQQYLFCRYPDMKLTVFNAGWGGDRATGALGRLDRDVLSLNPTIVTLFFGMNDGGYSAVNDNTVATYKKNMEGIITALQAKNVKVVVFTPGCVDPDRRKNLGDNNYNNTLETLGKAALELAKQYNCPSVDVIHPMLAFQNARKAENAGFTMIPDAVHPDTNGHLVMANTMLEAFGIDPMPALTTIDLQANAPEGTKIVTNTPDKVVIEVTPTATPFWCDSSNVSTLVKSGFINIAGQKLTIKGLKEGTYKMEIDGIRTGTVTDIQLKDGFLINGSYSARGKQLHDMIARKENNYFNLWRDIRIQLAALSSSKAIAESMMSVDTAYHTAIYELATPSGKTTISLTLIGEGGNLAESKSYVCSDPNTHNFGIGMLTDGLWDGTHVFATNEGPTFPKTVTIDLDKKFNIERVIAGVPAVGSTKTITVSVSADGVAFTEVGTYVFSQKKEERYTYKFEPTEARFVRLTYPDHYDAMVQYPVNFCFTSEVEVYGPAKAPAAK